MTTIARPPPDRPRRKKEARTDIWSNLLKQTAQAQARSRTQAIQHRELIVCGGHPDDQRHFLQSLARPPPALPASRNQDRRAARSRGEVRLSNRYAYGYGHVTLFSPPPQSGTGVQVLGAEAEEVARLEVHTLPDAEAGYVGTLRGLLRRKEAAGEEVDGDGLLGGAGEGDGDVEVEQRRPGVCVLLSWKKPWDFLEQIKKWIQLLATALLPDGVAVTDPMDVVRDAHVAVTVVVQHTETQEDLFRESYKEEDFDWISQCLRTAILPLHPLSALIYTSSAAPPQHPGNPLTEPQKVIFSSLALDLAALSPKLPRSADATTTKKEELAPKQEFMDRMAIVIPPAWDSNAFIRILSETFIPEDFLHDWLIDLQPPPSSTDLPATSEQDDTSEKPAHPGAEVYESSAPEVEDLPEATPSMPSAIQTYESRIIDPQSHRRHHITKTTTLEITTKPDQKFLAEMRAHLHELEASDATRERPSGVSTTSLSSGGRTSSGLPPGGATGALGELGAVSFNVGGVSYDSVSAEMAIERLRRPPGRETPIKSGRVKTDVAAGASEVKSPELPAIDKLEEYFASLVAKSGGSGSGGVGSSRDGTPGRGVRE